MAKDSIEVVVQGLLAAGQAAGLDRYRNDAHYKATIDTTAKVAVEALGIEAAEQISSDGGPLYRIRGLED